MKTYADSEEHVAAVMAQDSVSEAEAKMTAWLEGPLEGALRIDDMRATRLAKYRSDSPWLMS
jgi:hypothetical protein